MGQYRFVSGCVCRVGSVCVVKSSCDGIGLWGWMGSVCMVGRFVGQYRVVWWDLVVRGSVCRVGSVCGVGSSCEGIGL